jgi:hypothetical protein
MPHQSKINAKTVKTDQIQSQLCLQTPADLNRYHVGFQAWAIRPTTDPSKTVYHPFCQVGMAHGPMRHDRCGTVLMSSPIMMVFGCNSADSVQYVTKSVSATVFVAGLNIPKPQLCIFKGRCLRILFVVGFTNRIIPTLERIQVG